LTKQLHIQQELVKKMTACFICTNNMQWRSKEGDMGASTLGAGFEDSTTHFAVK